MSASARRRLVAAFVALAFWPAPGAPQAADLMELYLQAIESDPDFQRARIERQLALAALKESRAGLLPVLSANAEGSKVYQYIRESDNFLFPEGKSDYYNTGYTISLTQPVYRLDVIARLPQSRAEVRRAEAQFSAAEQDLIFRLAQTHFNFLAARENLEFASAERRAIAGQLQEAEERLGAGLVTIADVQDLRGRFALAQVSEIEAEDAMEEARQAIAEITGEAPADLKILGDTFPLVQPDRPDVESWVEASLFQNPRIQALQAALDAAEQEVRRQRGAYFPAFDLVATFDYSDSGGTVLGGGGGTEIQNREIALRLAVPIFDSGRTSARIQGAGLRRTAVLRELEKERRRVERETRTAFQGVLSGITRAEALDKSVFAHEAALAVKEQGWRSGINTGLIVLDARKELFSARRDLAHARYLYILQSLKLKQAAGILSMRDLRQINAYLQ